ncbi:MAG: peptidoglycan DD-metalloendopeptidase family protein [bacterium]
MNYTNCQSSNPNAVPALTDTIKQYLVVKYKDICTFTANFTMNDDGRSPDGVPNYSYSFNFIPVDLAGNTAIPANPVQDAAFQIDQALVLPQQTAGQDVTNYDFKFKILNKLNDLTNITTKFEVQKVQLDANNNPILTSSDPTKLPTTVYTYSLNDQTLIKNQYSSYAFTWNAGLLDVNNQYVVKVTYSNQSGVIGGTNSALSSSSSSFSSIASSSTSSNSPQPPLPKGEIVTPPLYTIQPALSFKPYTGNILANIGSQTITVFHDTDNPKDHKITNIGSNSYTASNPAFNSTIPDWGNPCTSSINPDGSANPACTTSYPITKDTNIVTNIQGERKADVEFRKYFTPNTVTAAATIFNPFILQGVGPQRNGDGGTSDRTMVIGTGTADETATSIVNSVTTPCYTISNTPIKNRRIGTCSDGLYKIRMRMVDSSGNNTATQGTANEPGYSANIDALDSWKDYVVERDTTKPVNPTLNLSLTSDKQAGEQISLSQYLGTTISGEARTEGNIHITAVSSTGAQIFTDDRYFRVPDTGTYSNSDLLLKPAICGGVKYKISVYLQDRATNRSSEISSNEVITDACPDCGGGQLQSPLHTGAKIAFHYGATAEYTSVTKSTFHSGVDYTGAGAEYGTPIYAAATGTVSYVGISDGTYRGLGNYVKISHANGLDTLYGHMNATPIVAVGQQVTTNTVLGYIGSTGFSTGNHLHFQVNVNGKHEDPEPYLNNRGSSNDPGNLSTRQRTIQGCVDLRGGTELDENGSSGGDEEDFNAPSRTQNLNTEFPLSVEDSSVQTLLNQVKDKLSGPILNSSKAMASIASPGFILSCVTSASLKLPNFSVAWQSFLSCAGVSGLDALLHLLIGLGRGTVNWVGDLFNGLGELGKLMYKIIQIDNNPDEADKYLGTLKAIWDQLTNKQLWQDIYDFTSKTARDPNFYYILAITSVVNSATGSSNELKNYFIAIGVYSAYQNKEAIAKVVNGLVVQFLEEMLNKPINDLADQAGTIGSYLTLEIMATFFSDGLFEAIKVSVSFINDSLHIVQYITKFTELMIEAASIIGYSTNRLARYIDETIDIAGQLVTVKKLASAEVGVWGGDALKYVDNANDAQFVEFVGKVGDVEKKANLNKSRYLKEVTGTKDYVQLPNSAYKPLRDAFDLADTGVRAKIWKKVAEYAEANGNTSTWANSNISLMKQGKAPFGLDGKRMEIHHIQPLSYGGNNDLSNLQILEYTTHQIILKGELHKPPFNGASNLINYGVESI